MWDRSKTRLALYGGVQSSDRHDECITAYGAADGQRQARRGRGAATAGGLIIMIAVGRCNVAIAEQANRNDVYRPFINIQP